MTRRRYAHCYRNQLRPPTRAPQRSRCWNQGPVDRRCTTDRPDHRPPTAGDRDRTSEAANPVRADGGAYPRDARIRDGPGGCPHPVSRSADGSDLQQDSYQESDDEHPDSLLGPDSRGPVESQQDYYRIHFYTKRFEEIHAIFQRSSRPSTWTGQRHDPCVRAGVSVHGQDLAGGRHGPHGLQDSRPRCRAACQRASLRHS